MATAVCSGFCPQVQVAGADARHIQAFPRPQETQGDGRCHGGCGHRSTGGPGAAVEWGQRSEDSLNDVRSATAQAYNKLNVLHLHLTDAQSFPFASEVTLFPPSHSHPPPSIPITIPIPPSHHPQSRTASACVLLSTRCARTSPMESCASLQAGQCQPPIMPRRSRPWHKGRSAQPMAAGLHSTRCLLPRGAAAISRPAPIPSPSWRS